MRITWIIALSVCPFALHAEGIPAQIADQPNIKLALQYQAEGEVELAKQQYEIAVREVANEKSFTAGHVLNLAGIYYHEAGMYPQAESLLRRSFVIWQELLGGENIALARILNRLACVYMESGQLEKAERLNLAEWASRVESEAPLSIDHINLLGALALMESERGRFQEARELDTRALGILGEMGEADSLDAVALLNQLGLLSLITNDDQNAMDYALRARKILAGAKDAHVFHRVANNGILARIYQKQKSYEKAVPLLEEALGLIKRACGDDSIRYAQVLHEYAMVLRHLDRDKEARRYAERAKEIAIQSGVLAFSTQQVDISELGSRKAR